MISSLVLSVKCRLNGLHWVKSENLEVVGQVTQLDLRDNCLESLDLSSVCSLETLYCQRNQLGTLTLSGFTLRMLHASSNRESNKASSSCYHCLAGCLYVQAVLLNDASSHKHMHKQSRCSAADNCFYVHTGLTTVNIYPVPNQLTHMDLSQ